MSVKTLKPKNVHKELNLDVRSKMQKLKEKLTDEEIESLVKIFQKNQNVERSDKNDD